MVDIILDVSQPSVTVPISDNPNFVPPKITTAWNPLDMDVGFSLSEDDLVATVSPPSSGDGSVRTVYGIRAGKFYTELTYELNGESNPGGVIAGIMTDDADITRWLSRDELGWGYRGFAGKKTHNSIFTTYGDAYGSSLPAIIGIALDLDRNDGTIWFSLNGVWQGSATIGEIETGDDTNAAFTGILTALAIDRVIHIAACNDSGSSSPVWRGNFGATDFTYTVPSGYGAGFGPSV